MRLPAGFGDADLYYAYDISDDLNENCVNAEQYIFELLHQEQLYNMMMGIEA